MDYIGKVCPYCKTEFKEGDDIVVCSVCEMPHHKECWIENKACTTFGCTGTISGIDTSSESVEAEKFCGRCGAKMKANQKFCASCGAAAVETGGPHYRVAEERPNNAYSINQPYMGGNQRQTYQTQGQYINNISNQQAYNQTYVNQDLLTFLQSSQDYYMSRFQKMQQNNSAVSWNWASFLFSAYWMIYRKMYAYAAVYLLACLIFSRIPGIGYVIALAMAILSGMFGNYLYKQYVDKELKTAQSMDLVNKNIYISKKGGTNAPAVLITIVIYLIVAFIIQNL